MEPIGYRISSSASSGQDQRTVQKSQSMRFTVRDLLTHFALIACLTFSSASVAASKNEASVVTELYRAYAWEAVVSVTYDETSPRLRHLADEKGAVLRQYFSPELTALLVADSECKVRTREICKLDFVPIFASQDPAAMDLSIKRIGPGSVKVSFTYPSSQEKIQIDYKVRLVGGKWLITDIVYPGLSNTSLRKLLTAPAP